MAQKLWEKNVRVNEEIDRFTVGRDREMDLYLAKHDVFGSMARKKSFVKSGSVCKTLRSFNVFSRLVCS